jgi:hypothetical protein
MEQVRLGYGHRGSCLPFNFVPHSTMVRHGQLLHRVPLRQIVGRLRWDLAGEPS